ncbi:MAG: MATE family efflux transporter [Candidatus Omnitrophica bacterium]|nr:MATE family efflux transporter [Candidatus Omnitrophota bacterium]MDD5429673.1 MATE family efflux transporter [Candidatus Omnitrophota bacterium]
MNRSIQRKEKPMVKGGVREMISIAMPMVISQACYTIMTFTDRMFLSRLGPEYMNAAMAGGLTAFMMMTFFLGLIGYTTALAAQYLGSGKKDKCAVTVSQAAIIALVAYPLILSCRPLAHGLFEFMGIIPGQLALQKIYFDILLWAVFVSLLRNCLSGFFSGIGKTKIVMISAFAAMLVNVVINYVLIFGKLGFPALGIRGAAYGTIAGGVSGLIILLVSYLGKTNRREYKVLKSLYFDKTVMTRLLWFGYPAGLEMFLNLLAFDIVIMIFHSAGAIAATAATIVFNWDMVSFVPLLGVEVGVMSLVGRYMGARDPDTAHKVTMSGLKMGAAYSAIVFVLFFGFPQFLTEIFRPSNSASVFIAAKPVIVFMIRLASIYVLVEAMIVVFIGALRGAGDTFWAMLISVSLHWVLVPVLFVLLKIYGVSLQISWSVVVGIFLMFSFLVYWRYSIGKWRKISVVSASPVVPAVTVYEDFHESLDL